MWTLGLFRTKCLRIPASVSLASSSVSSPSSLVIRILFAGSNSNRTPIFTIFATAFYPDGYD